jgi:hypothetical protein
VRPAKRQGSSTAADNVASLVGHQLKKLVYLATNGALVLTHGSCILFFTSSFPWLQMV